MRDTSAHDNPSATRIFVDDAPGNPFRTSHLPWNLEFDPDDAPGNPFRTSHLPWNLEFDPAVAPTTTRVDLGEPWVVGCRVGRMSGRRSAPEIRNTQGEYAAVLMVHSGTEILTQQGRTTEVRAGTAALWDGVRPVECFSAATLVKSTMFIPRALLAGAVPDLDSVFVRTIENSATLRLLTGWLDVSMRQTSLDRDAAHTAGRMAVDLLHSALARTRGDVSESREVLLLQIKDFLDRNLGDPDLTLDMVARANAVSVRYLHMLFQGTGETAREFLRRRRLERAQRLLLGSGPELPVAEVAIRSGFDSPSSFSRAYRTRFGVAPREARRQSTAA
ncbi:helix-turn-helix domain-containing protein [Rhodococcus sp. JVH1]|uniref:helix-turn-helix domain-containing protein n=1 Tax=Rhodococcus sp. JVH1 TaxID=745408 RepID=UPI000271DB73|nr:helix-turn-helix domain-containing protein [Rhodococcus sp. JVH1]EJI98065.1 transcriptional regulator, AraC family [Rhodococcus sp. JVH1]